jgi:hopene-associated glycosyltransferase HpnB
MPGRRAPAAGANVPAMSALAVLAALSLAAWVYLVFAHGRFWLCDQRLEGREPPPERWPAVAAVVPARDEADVLPYSLPSLLGQEYPGALRIVLVDDESTDGTGAVAERIAKEHPAGARLAVVPAPPRPPGWVGKMWAVETGVQSAAAAGAPDLWLLTDADVAHGPDDLRRLVARAEADGDDLVSLMVRLRADRGWSVLLVPAFVYFFQKLYPFPRVNDPRARTAAAAGGCVLVRHAALERAGGIQALRAEVIDDCALGRAVKRSGGRIWLGLSETERSIRPYRDIGDVWHMVARSAFTQLRHSSVMLAGTVLGLLLLYVVPPAVTLGWVWHGDAVAACLAAGAWLLSAATFVPTLALYERSPLWAFALPVAGLLYAGMTIDSARRHWRNQGAAWKGRTGAGRS